MEERGEKVVLKKQTRFNLQAKQRTTKIALRDSLLTDGERERGIKRRTADKCAKMAFACDRERKKLGEGDHLLRKKQNNSRERRKRSKN